MDRRDFLRRGLAAGATLALGGCAAREAARGARSLGGRQGIPTPRGQKPLLAVAAKGKPGALTRRAIDALGGIRKFVRSGQVVVIKPNIAWQRPPEQAATTNPEVVATLVRMCREAGAARVIVVEHSVDIPARLVFDIAGMQKAVDAVGGELISAHEQSMYREVKIGGQLLAQEQVIEHILAADLFINVPIAKSHDATKLTLSMKNLMGAIWNRQGWHSSASLSRCIAEFAGAVRPDLVVMDANRILVAGGPKGPGQTRDPQMVIASTDQVAVDAYCTGLFGMKPADIEHITIAASLGIGQADLAQVQIKHA